MAGGASRMIVAKLGGSLLTDVTTVREALGRIQLQPSIGIVVVSALKGQTRQLLRLAQSPSVSLANQYIHAWQQHFAQAQVSIDTPLIQTAFAVIARAGQQYQALSARQQDTLLAQGELLTSWLVYQLCQQLNFPTYWHDIRENLSTDNDYGNAKPLTCQLALRPSGCMITQGYIGADADGHTTTLGFEGSDYCASLIAVAAQAKAVWIYKDVGALYSANPYWLPEAKAYSYVSYQQAIAMTQAGARVLHPQAVQPAQQAQIPIHIIALDHRQQTRISQQAHNSWFALISPMPERLIVLGDTTVLDLQEYQCVRHTHQQVELILPVAQLEALARQWHQQLMEAQTCLSL